MFKKKAPKPPIPVKILTTELLIDAALDISAISSFHPGYIERLTDAKIQTARPGNIQPWSSKEFFFKHDNVVAFLAELNLEMSDGDEENQPSKSILFIGPYIFKGKIVRDKLEDISDEEAFIITDVEVSYLHPGANWGPLRAKTAFVNLIWLNGFQSVE